MLAIPWLRLLLAIGLTLGFAFLGSEYVARWLYRWLRRLGKRVIDVGPVRNAVLYGGSPVFLAMLYGALLVLSNPEASRGVQVAAGMLVVAFLLPISLLLIYFLDAWTDEYAEDNLRRQLVGAEPYDKELFTQSLERAKAELLDPEIDPIMRVIRQWRMTTLENEMARGRPKVPSETSQEIVSDVTTRAAERERIVVRAEGEVGLERKRLKREGLAIDADASEDEVRIAESRKKVREAGPSAPASRREQRTRFQQIVAAIQTSEDPRVTAQQELNQYRADLQALVDSEGLEQKQADDLYARMLGAVMDYLEGRKDLR